MEIEIEKEGRTNETDTTANFIFTAAVKRKHLGWQQAKNRLWL